MQQRFPWKVAGDLTGDPAGVEAAEAPREAVR
jgi:hypothetical protein